jgi:hypothetical protein
MSGHRKRVAALGRESRAELQRHLDAHRPRNRASGKTEPDGGIPREAGEESDAGGEGLELLYLALTQIETYAYPDDKPDYRAYRRIVGGHEPGPAPRLAGLMLRRRFFDPTAPWTSPRNGGAVPGNPLRSSFPYDVPWAFSGPVDLRSGGDAWSGRVNAVAVDPTNANVIYIGAAGGGVWKSLDGGVSWAPLSNAWPFEVISSIAIDPTTPSTLYVGTGDFHDYSTQSFGLMKSTDGGATFTNIAVVEAGEVSISAIVVDPNNPEVVTICGGRGRMLNGQVWQSRDGGQTWKTVIADAAQWSDIAIAAADKWGLRIYYAVGWNSTGGLMFRSFDQGATWTRLTVPWGAGQFAISVSPSATDPSSVYVLAGGDMKVFASTTSGSSWSDITGNLTQVGWDWGQAWYDWYLRCGLRGSVDTLFLGLKHLFIWDSASRSWTLIPSGHDDQHAFFVDPTNPSHYFLGNDGGVWSLTYDAATKAWSIASLNANLGITQLYKSGFSPQDRRVMLGGSQDNGLDSAQGNLGHWTAAAGLGDVVAAQVNPRQNRIQYAAEGVAGYGNYRTADHWVSSANITPPGLPGDVVDERATVLVVAPDGSGLYWATDFLWFFDEASQSWSSHLGNQRLASGVRSVVRAMGVAPSDSQRVYTGSNDGEVWMGQGPAWTWRQVDGAHAQLPNRVVTAISVNPRNPNDVLVGLGGAGESLWRCPDASSPARTWTNVSGGAPFTLPDVPVNAIARHPLDPEQRLFVGTDLGVFGSVDGGAKWFDLTLPFGLPRVPVTDLAISENQLHATTFGRGIWTARLEFTDVAPAATSIGDIIFFVAKGISGRVYICQARFGSAGSEWHEIAGDGRTDAAPAVITVGNSVFVFIKGLDGRVFLNQAEFGSSNSGPESFAQSFSGWFAVANAVTDAAPGAAAMNNHFFVFIKGLDQKVYVNQGDLGKAGSGWSELQGNGRTDAAPTAATVGNTVFVFVKGLNGRLYLNQADLGGPFGQWFEIRGDGLTDGGPAAAAIQKSVFCFVKGLDGRVFLNQGEFSGPNTAPSAFAQSFSGWFEVQGNGITDVAPGAGTVLVSLFVFIKGPDGMAYANQAEYRHAFSGWFPMNPDSP